MADGEPELCDRVVQEGYTPSSCDEVLNNGKQLAHTTYAITTGASLSVMSNVSMTASSTAVLLVAGSAILGFFAPARPSMQRLQRPPAM